MKFEFYQIARLSLLPLALLISGSVSSEELFVEKDSFSTPYLDLDPASSFGRSVAVSGNMLVGGAPNGGFLLEGNIRTFEFIEDEWVTGTKIASPDSSIFKYAYNDFGQSVAVDDFHNLMIVGDPGGLSNGNRSGTVYVYQLLNGDWIRRDWFFGADSSNHLGQSVAVDGLVVAAGEPDAENGGNVYVYDYSNKFWGVTPQIISPVQTLPEDQFGFSVEIDNEFMVVGAPNALSGVVTSGIAYVYRKIGGVWSYFETLQPSDGMAGDLFGYSVAIDGASIVVGAYNNDGTGSVYVYELDNDSWVFSQKFKAASPASGAYFGKAVDIQSDVIVVGADNQSTSAGRAYVFKRNGVLWEQEQVLGDPGLALSRFGASVSVDGSYIAVGGPGALLNFGIVKTYVAPIDTDNDQRPDFNDSFPNNPNEWSDADRDGKGDNSDNCFYVANSSQANIDGDEYGDACDGDIDGDGRLNEDDVFPTNPLEWADLDGDGIGDNSDPDKDGDGHNNNADAFPIDPAEWSDIDGDGVGDNSDPDRDGDGHNNENDAFPNDPSEWSDVDGDGVGGNQDNCPTVSNSGQYDQDGDGIGSACDSDKDGDGYPNISDAFPNNPAEWADLDGDGKGDNSDPDRDGDGHNNGSDAFPNNPSEWSDIDGDGIGDNSDPDVDGDGHNNNVDAFPSDPSEWADPDGDGVGSNSDNCPNRSNAGQADLDGDGLGNKCDADRDGDGYSNSEDGFPNNPNEWLDGDGDGIPNNSDPDMDGDGLINSIDPDRDGDGIRDDDDAFPADHTDWSDIDGDGKGDDHDDDRDGDGIPNGTDSSPDDLSTANCP